jgi:hypothetical protein
MVMLFFTLLVEGFKQGVAAFGCLLKNIKKVLAPLIILGFCVKMLFCFFYSPYGCNYLGIFSTPRLIQQFFTSFPYLLLLIFFIGYTSILFVFNKFHHKTDLLFFLKNFISTVGILIATFFISKLWLILLPFSSYFCIILNLVTFIISIFFFMTSIVVTSSNETFSTFVVFCKKKFILWIGGFFYLLFLSFLFLNFLFIALILPFIILNVLFGLDIASIIVEITLFTIMFAIISGVTIVFFASAHKNTVIPSLSNKM